MRFYVRNHKFAWWNIMATEVDPESFDILIGKDGRDLRITKDGDIVLTKSVPQAVTTRLNWWYNEWRFHPDYGIPYLEKIFVKNPNMNLVKNEFKKAIDDVYEVTNSEVTVLNFDKKSRKCSFDYSVQANGEGWLPTQDAYVEITDYD